MRLVRVAEMRFSIFVYRAFVGAPVLVKLVISNEVGHELTLARDIHALKEEGDGTEDVCDSFAYPFVAGHIENVVNG